MEAVKQYVVAVLVVAAVLLAYKGYRSYQHFEWLNIIGDKNVVYAIPSWRK